MHLFKYRDTLILTEPNFAMTRYHLVLPF